MSRQRADGVLRHLHAVLPHQGARQQSDRELLQRFAAGRDEQAFAELVRRHGPMVLAVCRRVLHHPQDAEDAFQGAFLSLARKAGASAWQESVGHWLHLVAHRLALRLRKQASRRQPPAAPPLLPPTVDPLEAVSGRELCAVLDEELCRLPERYRAAIVLCCLEGMTRDEAARQLGWSLRQLKRRLERGRAMLRARLQQRGFEVPAVLAGALVAEGSSRAAVAAELASRVVGTATNATATSAQVAALVQEFCRGLVLSRLRIAAVVLLASSLLGGLGLAVGLRQDPEAPPQPAVGKRQTPPGTPEVRQDLHGDLFALNFASADPGSAPEVRRDLHGDPLPPGALARLGTVRFRFVGWIFRMAFSPDGTRLLGAGTDGIRLWDSSSGRPIRLLGGSRTDFLAFLDRGKCIATRGENLVVWEIADGKEVSRVPLPQGGLECSVLSPDGKVLAGVGKGRKLLLVDTAMGGVLRQLEGNEDNFNKLHWVHRFAFAPDSKTLASVSMQDARVFLWDVATGRPRHVLGGHKEPAAAAFSPDGRLLAVGDNDGIIRLWDPAAGRELRQLRGHVGMIQGLAFAPNGKTLASGATGNREHTRELVDSTVRLWDVETGKARTLPGPASWAQCVAFSPDGKTLAVGGSGTTLYAFDLETGKDRTSLAGHDEPFSSLALCPDGSILASGGSDNLIHLWDLKTSKETARLEGHQGYVTGLAFTTGGRELVSCSYDGTVRVWDWQRGKETRRFAQVQPSSGNPRYGGFDLAPDGTTLVLPTGQFWDVATGEQTGTVPNYKGIPFAKIVFAPDGKRLASPNREAARVLDARSGREICRFTGHEPVTDGRLGILEPRVVVDCVAFSPDGRRAASGGAEGLAFIWDAATGKMLRRLQGHTNPVSAIAFSPDGRTVATASGEWHKHDEQTVRLWEVTTGKERRRFVGHQAGITSIVFSRDGSTLVSCSGDGTALVWDTAGIWKPRAAKAANAEALWRDLAGEDVGAAYEAVCALAARKEAAFLVDHLRPVAAADPALLGRLIADLDSDAFAKRQQAERDLGKLEEMAEPALRKAAADSTSPEVRRRAEALLARLESAVPAAGTVQALRAAEVLERIGTPEARQLLQHLAAGAPEALLTREAKSALERLRSRLPSTK